MIQMLILTLKTRFKKGTKVNQYFNHGFISYIGIHMFFGFLFLLVDKCFFFMNNLGLLEITEWETWSKPIKYQFVRFCPFVGPPSDCCRWICAVLLRVNRHYQNCYCSLRTFSDLALVFFVISLVSFYLQICWTEGVSLMRNRFLCEANCDQIRLRRHPCSVLMLCSGSMYHRSEKRL